MTDSKRSNIYKQEKLSRADYRQLSEDMDTKKSRMHHG